MSGRRVTVAQVVLSLRTGGLERVVVDLVNRLDAERFRSVVYCVEDPGELADRIRDRAGVRVFGKSPGVSVTLPFRIARALRRDRVDLVHCHNHTAYLYGSAAARMARAVPAVCTAHGPDIPRSPRHVRYQRVCPPARLIAVSDHVRDRGIEAGVWRADAAVTIHNGIDTATFEGAISREDARRRLDLPDATELVGCVARLSPEKGVDVLLEAFPEIAARRPAARLVLVGDGPSRDDLESLAQRLGVDGRTTFAGCREDVAHVLPAFDVFVAPSREEGLGITVLEAMAAGVPVVASDTGGIPELVTDGETGWLVPPGDASAIAARVCRLLDSPEEARDAVRAAGRLVRASFSIERMVSAYEDLYSQLTVETRGGRT